jgi:hypothetical protein
MIDMEIYKKAAKIVESDVPNRHSFFQLNCFVLGKEPTHQAKLRRCVEELRSRKKDIDSCLLQIDDLQDRNDLIRCDMSYWTFKEEEREIRCRIAERTILQNNNAIDELKSKMKGIEEEMLFFSQAFEKLSEVEPIKQWDDTEVQMEYWNAKLYEDIQHRLLMRLPIDVEIIRTVLAMPPTATVRKQMVSLLDKQKEVLTIQSQ